MGRAHVCNLRPAVLTERHAICTHRARLVFGEGKTKKPTEKPMKTTRRMNKQQMPAWLAGWPALTVSVVTALAATGTCPNQGASFNTCQNVCRDGAGNPLRNGTACMCSTANNLIFCDYNPNNRCESTGNTVNLRIDTVLGKCFNGGCQTVERVPGESGTGTIMQTIGC